MNRKTALLLTFSLSAVGLAACSSQPPSTPTSGGEAVVVEDAAPAQSDSSQSAEEVGPSEDDLLAYFEALASSDPARMKEAEELAAPGSNAQAYAIYLAAAEQARRDGGAPGEPSTAQSIDGGFSLCPDSPSTENPCADYTNIQHKGDKIADFETGGEPLEGRLSLGSDKPQALGTLGDVTLIASYKTILGYVIVVVDVESRAEGFFPSASYRAPDGRQSDAGAIEGPTNLAEGSRGYYAFFFEGAEFGGELLLSAWADDAHEEARLTLPTTNAG